MEFRLGSVKKQTGKLALEIFSQALMMSSQPSVTPRCPTKIWNPKIPGFS